MPNIGAVFLNTSLKSHTVDFGCACARTKTHAQTHTRAHAIWEVEQIFDILSYSYTILNSLVNRAIMFIFHYIYFKNKFNLITFFFILHQCLLSLSACLALRAAKCGLCCRSKPRFVMEMFLFTPPHINLAHLICSLLPTMSTRSVDRARPRHVEERKKRLIHLFYSVLSLLRNKTIIIELKSHLKQGEGIIGTTRQLWEHYSSHFMVQKNPIVHDCFSI